MSVININVCFITRKSYCFNNHFFIIMLLWQLICKCIVFSTLVMKNPITLVEFSSLKQYKLCNNIRTIQQQIINPDSHSILTFKRPIDK